MYVCMYVCIKFLEHDSATHIILIIQTKLRKNYDSFPYLPYGYFLFYENFIHMPKSYLRLVVKWK